MISSEKFKRFMKYHFPAIFIALSILILSSIPNLSIPNPNKINFGDKILHAVEYGIFSLFLWWSLSHHSNETVRKYSPMIALFIAISWGAFDEFYQSTVPGRLSDSFDWIADTIGACITQTAIIIRSITRTRTELQQN